ncbi:MAG: VCBS repeat-containing protein [Armatimonadetes bacterium]|nr:VCBS repeat-containing protein [Armatimonadota bacterium]
MPLRWRKALVADERYESAAVFDVNNDGFPDIVSGAWWYEGPTFRAAHYIGEVRAVGEYFDDFATLPVDVNGDGHTDFITGGWWGKVLLWRENPGPKGGEWTDHVIAEVGSVETARAWDVDGDGRLEFVPNTPGDPLVVLKLVTDAAGKGTGEFARHTIYGERQGHGLGFGDITGSGRGDFVLNKGWLESPPDPLHGEWSWHADFDLGGASIPVLVVDVNGDGLNDLIVGQGHDYGLDWWEQGRDAQGSPTWRRHPIDPFNAGFHDLQWADIDGDGQSELATGKRYRAHCGKDPGEADDLGVYYYKWTGECFAKQVIEYGPIREATGCGIAFALADLRGTGRLDIVAPGKDGLYVFYNEGL